LGRERGPAGEGEEKRKGNGVKIIIYTMYENVIIKLIIL
jgi:hypothetical protein